nr:hypothetical protein [Brevundimonas naejangsanensis]
MQITLSARGGKAPPAGLTQTIDGADNAIERYHQMDALFDGTATITMNDRDGVLLTLDDLHRMKGSN